MSEATRNKNAGRQKPPAVPKPGPEVNKFEVEILTLGGKKARVVKEACRLCGSYVHDGKVHGGWLTYHYVSRGGRVCEGAATCVCVIGEYRADVLERGNFRFQRYAKLPWELKLFDPRPDDETDIAQFNRDQYCKLCTKIKQAYWDIETGDWVTFDEKGEEQRAPYSATARCAAVSARSAKKERAPMDGDLPF